MLSPDLEMNVSCTSGETQSSSFCPKATSMLIILICVCLYKKFDENSLFSEFDIAQYSLIKFSFHIGVCVECQHMMMSDFRPGGDSSLCCRANLKLSFFCHYLPSKMPSSYPLPHCFTCCWHMNFKYSTHLRLTKQLFFMTLKGKAHRRPKSNC